MDVQPYDGTFIKPSDLRSTFRKEFMIIPFLNHGLWSVVENYRDGISNSQPVEGSPWRIYP